jgi:hypothetical protein
MVYAEASQRTAFAGVARRLGLYALVTAAMLGLAGIAWTVNDAIGRHHDRIALKGLNGKPSPVAITVGSEPLVIPANLIRSPTDRRGGLVTAMDLLVHWPSLDGFSEERAEVFRDGSPKAPLIYVTITEAEAPLDATRRLTEIYSLYFDGPAIPGPGHLAGRHMKAESPYRDEIVYFEPQVAEPYVVRCLAEETEEIPATCIREVNIGHGLTMLYRFNRASLGDWRTMDDRLRRLVSQLFRSTPQSGP